MAISQPISSDPLNVPDHSLLHRIIASDPDADIKSLIVDSSSYVGIATTAPDRALEINHFSGACLRLTYNDSNGSATTKTDFDIDDAGQITISSPNAKTIVLQPAVYDDMIMPALNLKVGVTPPTFAAFQNGVYGYSFIDGQSDELHGTCEIPHTYKEGTDLSVHVHWSPNSTNTGNCVWIFEYTKANQNVKTFLATDTLTASIDIAGSGIINRHQYTPIGTISGAGIKVGDIIAFRIARPTGDSFTGNAFMHSIGMHYQIDTLGSRAELTK